MPARHNYLQLTCTLSELQQQRLNNFTDTDATFTVGWKEKACVSERWNEKQKRMV